MRGRGDGVAAGAACANPRSLSESAYPTKDPSPPSRRNLDADHGGIVWGDGGHRKTEETDQHQRDRRLHRGEACAAITVVATPHP